MNIFPTDRSAYRSAMALDDKRIVRQASEVVVILGAVAALQGIPSPYKEHHQPAHKLIRWLLDPEAWRWTAEYAHACNLLYRDIYGKECVCLPKLRDLRGEHMRHHGYGTKRVILPPHPEVFANCASNRSLGLDFTHVLDVHAAYRLYLRARWAGDKRPPVWSKRTPPIWRVDSAEDCGHGATPE